MYKKGLNMKYFLLIFGILISTITACGQDNMAKHQKYKKSDIVIIDTRTQEEFNAGNVDGSLLIPYNEIGNKIASVVKDKSKPIAVYCRSGNRSGVAQRILESMGYTNVVNYGGLGNAKRLLDAKK